MYKQKLLGFPPKKQNDLCEARSKNSIVPTFEYKAYKETLSYVKAALQSPEL